MSNDDAHLLIVDDDERIRGLLQKFLMRSGFLVSTWLHHGDWIVPSLGPLPGCSGVASN